MKKSIFLLAVGLIAASGLSTAAPACASGQSIIGTSGPITVAPGNVYSSTFSCQIGSNVFSNFSIVTNAGFPASSLFSLALTVNTAGTTLDFGITESGGEDVRLFFQISGGINDMGLTVAGVGSTILETICSADLAGATICPTGTQLANFAVTSGNGGDSGVFAVVPTDYVFKDIEAGSGISDFQQTIIPEPMTLTLMGAGLLGLGIYGRRRSK